MKESNLSPPVLAKNKGTVVFRLVPLQGEVSGSVLDCMPILQSLHQINFYSSSLRWSFASIGLRLALIQTYIAENSSLFYFLQHPFKRSYWSGLLIFIRFLIK